MNDKPVQPIQHMVATCSDEEDYLYVIDADGVLWGCYVNFNGTEWKRVPIKEDAT